MPNKKFSRVILFKRERTSLQLAADFHRQQHIGASCWANAEVGMAKLIL